MSNLKKRVLSVEIDDFNPLYFVLRSSGKRLLVSKSYVRLALYAAHLCHSSICYVPSSELADFVDSIIDFANYKFSSSFNNNIESL